MKMKPRFCKKKPVLKRAAPLYCACGHKKKQMELICDEDNTSITGHYFPEWMSGKETWRCKKCNREWIVKYTLTVTNKKDD
jgi:hypothetical protein